MSALPDSGWEAAALDEVIAYEAQHRLASPPTADTEVLDERIAQGIGALYREVHGHA